MAGGFIAGRGFIKCARAPQKIQPKISHIIKGFPLGQYLADFKIRSGKINLNGLINACGNNIELKEEVSEYRLTADQKYLCKTMGTKLPLLPVVGKEENQLFERLILTAPRGPLNFEQMAIEWRKEVDAVNIFPKLPVYLRTHYSKWQRNQRVRDAVAKAAPGEARLHELNAATFGLYLQPSTTTQTAMMGIRNGFMPHIMGYKFITYVCP